MGIRERMVEILRSSETRRIRFSFRGTSGLNVSVDHTTFARVADALAAGRLGVVEGHFDNDMAMYTAWAERGRQANTFYLGNNPRWSRSFNALIVHESVHASFDLNRVEVPWVDNEAAAYIAQGFYLRNSGYSRDRLDLGSGARNGYAMVNEIINGGDPDFFLNVLRDSLLADPQYHSYIRTTFRGDG